MSNQLADQIVEAIQQYAAARPVDGRRDTYWDGVHTAQAAARISWVRSGGNGRGACLLWLAVPILVALLLGCNSQFLDEPSEETLDQIAPLFETQYGYWSGGYFVPLDNERR